MIQAINSIKPTLVQVTKNPKTVIGLASGTLAVLATHQVWPHPESPRCSLPQIEVEPETPKLDILDTDFDPEQYTPMGDIVANDNIVEVAQHVSEKVHTAFENVVEFIENLTI